MQIATPEDTDLEGWRDLRRALWPDCPEADHLSETAAIRLDPGSLALIARIPSGEVVAFAEARLRTDPVNGCATSPVAFLEGIYVAEAFRRRGIARALVRAVEAWAVLAGCSEFASDALIDNGRSHAMHRALGFVETERVVYFRKDLTADARDGRGPGRGDSSRR
jgi:aminoglycoside 6'-N-acetyltransferase I